jgi:hypothetical protein
MQKKKKRLILTGKAFEVPNKEQAAKKEYITTDRGIRAKYESNLHRYLAQGIITEDQFRAGNRLFISATVGGALSGIKGMDPTTMGMTSTGAKGEMSDYRCEKYMEYLAAMNAPNLGRVNKNILYWVCILDNDLTSFDQSQKNDTRYAKRLLAESLTDLVEFYCG